mgnify:CR=1 FL=1
MAGSGVVIGFPNFVDAVAPFATVAFSGGTWIAGMPLSNMRDPRFDRVARSNGLTLAATKFDVDLGTPRRVFMLAIPKHNLSLGAKVRVRLSNDAAFATSLHDSGWVDAWPIIYAWGSVPWGHPGLWTGRASSEDVAGYPVPFIHFPDPAPDASRYARVEIDDTTNAAGFVELPRLFITGGWQPSRNFAPSTDLEAAITRGGSSVFNERPSRRTLSFDIDFITRAEALTMPGEMDRKLGRSGQVMIVMHPADTANRHRTSFAATLVTRPRVRGLEKTFAGVRFEVEEVL